MRVPVLQGVLPVERSRVPGDALAGLTLAAIGVPEVLGYAKIAGMLLAARLARLAFLASFLSRTVLVGFLTGVGIQVAAGQLPDMLGIHAAGQSTVPKLVNTVRALPHVHWADVAISAGVIVIVLAARMITRRMPGPLIAVIAAIAVSRARPAARLTAWPWWGLSRAGCRAWGCPRSACTRPAR